MTDDWLAPPTPKPPQRGPRDVAWWEQIMDLLRLKGLIQQPRPSRIGIKGEMTPDMLIGPDGKPVMGELAKKQRAVQNMGLEDGDIR
jgi:hypothetical protein